jgi:hypothetical protein
MNTLGLLDQFNAVVDSIYGVYLDSTRGFQLARKDIDETQQKTIEKFQLTHPQFANLAYLDSAQMLYGKGDPNQPGAVLLHRCTQAQFKSRNEPGGDNYRFVANVSLVALCQYWEDFYRGELASATGIAKNDITADVMGDIRYLRQSIIHNSGIATSDVAKCRILRWFTPGELIYIDADKFETLISEVKKFIQAFADAAAPSAVASAT